MIEVWVKATNCSTKEIIYEGLKKSYKTYDEAFIDMRNVLADFRGTMTSWRLPNYYQWTCPTGPSCYITHRHGNCRLTTYIKKY